MFSFDINNDCDDYGQEETAPAAACEKVNNIYPPKVTILLHH